MHANYRRESESCVAILDNNRLYQNMKRKVRLLSANHAPSAVAVAPSSGAVTPSPRAAPLIVVKHPRRVKSAAIARKPPPTSETGRPRPKSSAPAPLRIPYSPDIYDSPDAAAVDKYAALDSLSVDSDYCSWKDGEDGHVDPDDDDECFRVRFEELQRALQSQVDVCTQQVKLLNCCR